MKQLVLIKRCPEIHLAHLYEHLYVDALTDFFQTKQLLHYIDYRWQARTYHGGFIHLEISLVSRDAKNLEESVKKQTPYLDHVSISRAIAQMEAECKKHFWGNGDRLIAALEKLHVQPWITLDEFDFFDTHAQRRSSHTMWSTDNRAYTRTLTCEIAASTDSIDRKLLPLFKIIAITIQDNLTLSFDKNDNYYLYSNHPVYDRKAAREIYKYRVRKSDAPSMEDTLLLAQTTMDHLVKHGVIKRIEHFLQKVLDDAIDEIEVYDSTEILVGSSGWKHLGTEENIVHVLSNSTLLLKSGGEKRRILLSDFV